MNDAKDLTPATWKSGELSYNSALTLNTAKKMLEAGQVRKRQRNRKCLWQ